MFMLTASKPQWIKLSIPDFNIPLRRRPSQSKRKFNFTFFHQTIFKVMKSFLFTPVCGQAKHSGKRSQQSLREKFDWECLRPFIIPLFPSILRHLFIRQIEGEQSQVWLTTFCEDIKSRKQMLCCFLRVKALERLRLRFPKFLRFRLIRQTVICNFLFTCLTFSRANRWNYLCKLDSLVSNHKDTPGIPAQK